MLRGCFEQSQSPGWPDSSHFISKSGYSWGRRYPPHAFLPPTFSSDSVLTKTEPVFQEKTQELEIQEETVQVEADNEPESSADEFSGEEGEADDDFNQEAQEELLDIPTFLRRQAN